MNDAALALILTALSLTYKDTQSGLENRLGDDAKAKAGCVVLDESEMNAKESKDNVSWPLPVGRF